jgi:aspartate racemase
MLRVKTIGLLGGMSWESTELYYRLINENVKNALGGLHSAPIAMVSVDFREIEELQRAGDWERLARILSRKAMQVESAGADLLLICTNTMHKVAAEVSDAIDIPLLHIADATADRIASDGVSTIGLLGTRFTMEQGFYKDRLAERGLNVLVPSPADRDLVHRVIYEELCLGRIEEQSRNDFVGVIAGMAESGAEAVIQGCTEIGLLVNDTHTDVRLYDTTRIHAEQAVEAALA